MKKIVISLLLIASMMFGMVACGGSSKNDNTEAGTDNANAEGSDAETDHIFDNDALEENIVAEMGILVRINGNEYDLTDDFKTLAGQMAKDGLNVLDCYMGGLYDENGERIPNSNGTPPEGVRVQAGNVPLNRRFSPIMRQMFYLYPQDNEYEAASGICFNSSKEDLENLDGYMYYNGRMILRPHLMEKDTYYALYVDGKMVDLEEYRDEFDAWRADMDALGTEAAFLIHMGEGSLFAVNQIFELGRMGEFQQIEAYFSEEGSMAESRILLAFAALDAGRRLENKEISAYDIIEYSYVEEKGVFMCVEHFYLDAEAAQYDSGMREMDDKRRQERLDALLAQ